MQRTESAKLARAPAEVAKLYLATCKPKVVALMLLTMLISMALAAPEPFPWGAALLGLLGVALVAGAAAAINHIADHRIDQAMKRTRARPLPSGELSVPQVLRFAAAIGTLGAVILTVWVNALTAVLTLLSLLGYAVVYTRFLKYATPQNIVIGGAAGATPPILGWTAVTGHIEPQALLLFLIIFAWTPPHFWALALYRKDEYSQAGVPMLPVTHGENFTRLHILLYTILLVVVSTLPFLIGMSGLVYLCGALSLGGFYLYHAIMLMRTRDPQRARAAFAYSIVYLGTLFALMLADARLPALAL